MLTSKWHMHKLGLVDFWYYTQEEFYFKDGHMLLRGSNGSGKSVTMQSFIPLLLDGNKSSERLDSFGTRSRKLENYLIDENDGRSDRIGYLYIEFKREDSDVYKTIGLGLHARKGKALDSWYFVIEDNRRITKDISLMEKGIAISKQQLKNQIGDQFIDSQRTYMERVNQALFGFETLDAYKEAIALLIQLRSPKLSNSLKPTIINDVLSDSLQPLSEDDLRPMSEAISNMDSHKDRIDALKQSLASADAIMKVYDKYNRFVLLDKYRKYDKQKKHYEDITQTLQLEEKTKDRKEKELVSFEKQKAELKVHQQALEEEQKSLGSKDAQVLYEEVAQLKKEKEELVNQQEKKTMVHEQKQNLAMDAKTKMTACKEGAEVLFYEIEKEFTEINGYEDILQFSEHKEMKKEFYEQKDKTYEFTYVFQRIDEESKELQKGLQLFQDYAMHKQQVDAEMEQRARLEDKMEQQQIKLKQHEEQYIGIVEEYKERFRQWREQNQILKLSDQVMQAIFDKLVQYEEIPEYHTIQNMIHEEYQEVDKTIYSKKLELEQTYHQIVNSLQDAQEELQVWQQQKDPEPQQDPMVKKSREQRKLAKIPYRSFYTLLEFDPSLNQELRSLLEEALRASQLLDMSVIPATYRDQVLRYEEGCKDQYLFVHADVGTLSSLYFKGDTMQELQEQLQMYLQQLGVDASIIQLQEEYYQHGLLSGTYGKQQPAMYIGKEARAQYRKQKIEEYTKLCDLYNQDKVRLEEQLQELQEQSIRLEEEKNAYPMEDDLHLANREVKQLQQSIQTLIEDIQAIDHQMEQITEVLRKLSLEIQQVCDHLMISTKASALQQRKDAFDEYRQAIQRIQMHHSRYLSKKEMEWMQRETYASFMEDVDTLFVELETLQQKVDAMVLQIQYKEQQLQILGYDEIKQRLEEITTLLLALPDQLETCNQKIGNLHAEINTLSLSMEQHQSLVKELKKQHEQYYFMLSEEVQLHYCIEKEVEEQDWILQLEQMMKQNDQKQSSMNLAEELQMIVYQHRDHLQENNITLLHILPHEELEDIQPRIDIETRYLGTKISLPTLRMHLEKDIIEEESLLLESDKNLFEEILVNVISKQIRKHIQNSVSWVNRMNRYMANMNTSSGLKLNLKWEKKQAESEEELHTKELIELLQMDPILLKPADRQKLSTHFRRKIASARRQQEEEGNLSSFHQLMKDAMDYRKWFEFKIMTQKTGEQKKELTNNLFFSYSGGEKAMSMYVPLFSAVAAKFESARDDAPMLIALDEAFAGVDAKNIDNMFSLIGKFGFDYIMNSQVLWGDYGSVKALAIYELFRPENAKFVTVIAYEWNGKEKVLKV